MQLATQYPTVGSAVLINLFLLKSGLSFPPSERADPFPVIPAAKDLINKLLQVDPNERLDADHALQHPWMLVCVA